MPSSDPELAVEQSAAGTETRGTITATIDGTPVGALHFADYDGTMQIPAVVVVKGYRRQGVGRAMIAELRRRFPASRLTRHIAVNDAGRAFADALIPEYGEPTV